MEHNLRVLVLVVVCNTVYQLCIYIIILKIYSIPDPQQIQKSREWLGTAIDFGASYVQTNPLFGLHLSDIFRHTLA